VRRRAGAKAPSFCSFLLARRPSASIAGDQKRELAIHHSKTIAGPADALSFVTPLRSLFTAGISINILNIGDQQVVDENNIQIGTIFPRDVVFAASFASRFAKRLAAGVNYKLIQLRVDCSGICSTVGTEVQSSRAVDLGAQYQVEVKAPLTFGAAIRNLGGKLNSRETNQRNPLPTQVEIGAMYRLKFIDRHVKDTELRASGSFVDTRSFGGNSVRFGTDVMYQGKVHLRAGYVGHDRRGDASAALGFGLQSGGLVFDLARTFGGIPADNGQAPVYVSLRYLF